jgi:hypothetical protein
MSDNNQPDKQIEKEKENEDGEDSEEVKRVKKMRMKKRKWKRKILIFQSNILRIILFTHVYQNQNYNQNYLQDLFQKHYAS